METNITFRNSFKLDTIFLVASESLDLIVKRIRKTREDQREKMKRECRNENNGKNWKCHIENLINQMDQ